MIPTDRRQFIRTSAFAGAWSMLAPHARAQGANDDLRVAVIGLNSRGTAHIDGALRAKGVRLVALCDADQAVLDRRIKENSGKAKDLKGYQDVRKLVESNDIDAVMIATPNHSHAWIASLAAAHGKHVYVEKPVSHNVLEGRQLVDAAAKYKVIIQHGFQRRSETCWEEAADWANSGKLGKLKLVRGMCYKPRPSIGKVGSPQQPPASVDAEMWFGPREVGLVRRKQFHYDWHWQFDYGNGDLGNQGPHQLDVCRWFLGDPALPTSILSAGGRCAHDDDGEWANTQIVWFDFPGGIPALFEVRGLPAKNLDYKSGMDNYRGQSIGNVIEYEGGYITGGHSEKCEIRDEEFKVIKDLKGGRSHFQEFFDAVRNQSITAPHGIESGHLSSAMAHLGNISWRLGTEKLTDGTSEAFKAAPANDALTRMAEHLAANEIDLASSAVVLGKPLTFDPVAERFTGDFSDEANPLLSGTYRKGFEIA